MLAAGMLVLPLSVFLVVTSSASPEIPSASLVDADENEISSQHHLHLHQHPNHVGGNNNSSSLSSLEEEEDHAPSLLVLDFEMTMTATSGEGRRLASNDDEQPFGFFSSSQWCQFFDVFRKSKTLLSDDFCPPPPCHDGAHDGGGDYSNSNSNSCGRGVECTRIGRFCRNAFGCRSNPFFRHCCPDCWQVVPYNCDNWCGSCVPPHQRCDLYSYFDQKVNPTINTPTRFRFNLFRDTLCIPSALGHQCNNAAGAELFCSGYVSNEGTECLDSCISIVNNPELCPCVPQEPPEPEPEVGT
jgi:hypothetical protein